MNPGVDLSRDARASCRDGTILRLAREASKELKKALKMEPHRLEKEVDFVEVRIARLRDCLIDHLRSERDGPLKQRWRDALESANIALSFVVAVEYPATGIHRKLLEQADDVLKDLIDKVK